ncbi:MAG: GNAT family N-acetyltransferase [Pseudomonadota bacterium]
MILRHATLNDSPFGLFTVEPSLQAKGIGKKLLAFAESEAIQK